MNMFKVAIMGAGAIAAKMAYTINRMEEAELYAIASRDITKAERFAKEYNVEKAYGSYEEMVKDENIDLVYVAVPHTHHYICSKMCLEAGRNVLCEKPFCVNEAQAEELIKLAKSRSLLITEAIWTRYMPSRKIIDNIIKDGLIGEVTSLTANIGYELSEVERIWKTSLAGGALMDVGIYLVHFARMIFGESEAKITSSAYFKNGVDAVNSIIVEYEDGKTATMQSSVVSVLNRDGNIFGTEGYIEITNINNPEKIKVFDKNYKEVYSITVPDRITGYEYEILACRKAIGSGLIECDEIPHRETVEVMKIMDSIRKSWGYEVPDLR